MALEAAVFPQEPFNYRDLSNLAGMWSHGVGSFEDQEMMDNYGGDQIVEEMEENSSTSDAAAATAASEIGGRRKRRRAKNCKNKEEVENQRMTHIAVERNRRKQMNDYLAVLRSLMPPSYVQRGDQASILGGAINYVKELEQLLQSLEAQKQIKEACSAATAGSGGGGGGSTSPFTGFFSFPQYSSCGSSTTAAASNRGKRDGMAAAEVEVTLVESHANLKVMSRWRPKQLLKMVAGLQSLRLTTLHLNLTTTLDHMVLYSFSLKVEDNSSLTTVDDITAAVSELVGMIEEECSAPWHLNAT